MSGVPSSQAHAVSAGPAVPPRALQAEPDHEDTCDRPPVHLGSVPRGCRYRSGPLTAPPPSPGPGEVSPSASIPGSWGSKCPGLQASEPGYTSRRAAEYLLPAGAAAPLGAWSVEFLEGEHDGRGTGRECQLSQPSLARSVLHLLRSQASPLLLHEDCSLNGTLYKTVHFQTIRS